jgi:hypothetical protein
MRYGSVRALLLIFIVIFSACSSTDSVVDGDGDQIADGDFESDTDSSALDGDQPDGDLDNDSEKDKVDSEFEEDGDRDLDSDYVDNDADVEQEAELTWNDILLEKTCTPDAEACDSHAVVDTVFSSYRKDYFLPYEDYPEASIPDPIHGGRVQIVARAALSGAVTEIRLNGQNVDTLTANVEHQNSEDMLWLHWVHVWPRTLTAGEAVWVMFHSHESVFDTTESMHIELLTEEGTALDGDFSLAQSPIKTTYITTDDAYSSYLIHLHNTSNEAQTATRLVLNGRDVTKAACIPDMTIRPGEHVLWTVPLCVPVVRGDAYTVAVEFENVPAAIGAGRVIAAFFPVQTWPQSVDCPFPGGNEGNFLEHRAHGFDTFFLGRNVYDYEDGHCNNVTQEQALAAAQDVDDIWMMIGRETPAPENTSRIARLIGDEADTSIGANALGKAQISIQAWQENPEIATYLGGSRNRHTAAFAGVADIQGMDIYIGGCPPYILDFGNFPPLRSVYDYALTTKLNHMPMVTWIYSQGFSVAWTLQPNSAEARISTMSVILSGAKGLMYFQTNLERAHQYTETWEGIGQINRDIRAIRPYLREGDITGLAQPIEGAIVDVIRARDVLVLGVMNTRTLQETTDAGCLTGGIAGDPYEYILDDHTVDIRFEVPTDMAISRYFEVSNGKTIEMNAFSVARSILVPDVQLSHALPNRFFVFANSDHARQDVQQRLDADDVLVEQWENFQQQ